MKPDLARRQMDAETPAPLPQPERKLRRYHGTVSLDPAGVGRDASKIAEEVIAHLVGLVGSSVEITLEIEAEIPRGCARRAGSEECTNQSR